MKPEKKPAVKSAVVKSAVTTRAIERDVQRRQQAAHRMDAQRPHVPRLAAEAPACYEAPAPACYEAPAPAPTLREELNAQRRREIGAPMATLAQPPMFDPDPVMAAIARLPLMLLMAAFIAGLALGRAL